LKHPVFGNGCRDISVLQALRRAASSGDICSGAWVEAAGEAEGGASWDAAIAPFMVSPDTMLAQNASDKIVDFCEIDITPLS